MRSFAFQLVFRLCLAIALWVGPLGLSGGGPHAIAWADDDGDDGGDDDGDDGGSTARSGGSDRAGGSPRRAGRQAAASRRATSVPPPPEFLPEIVVLGLAPDDLTILLQEGFALLETRGLVALGADLIRLAPPVGLELTVARTRVRLLPSGATADFNHLYRTSQQEVPASTPQVPGPGESALRNAECTHANCAAHDLVGWPDRTWRGLNCPVPLPEIGIIDTGVNSDHDLIENGQLDVIRLNPDQADASGKVHGTAIVSVFAGKPGSRVEGLLPEATYVVADVFSTVEGDERADAFSLIRGLDLLASRQIRIINLSLAGPDNATLSASIAELVQVRDRILIAAVGNGGPDKSIAYPAAYPGVIGVTALDRRGRIYRSAQRGPEVDLAAPGSGLLLATSISGAKEKSGTSFAVPFVTAAVALIVASDPARTHDAVRGILTGTARDLGETGHDPVFGHGVLQGASLCS